jgi:hypothetical protein
MATREEILEKIKQRIIWHISTYIDEGELFGLPDSFIEMDGDAMHLVTNISGFHQLFFKVSLEQVDETVYDEAMSSVMPDDLIDDI